MDRTKQLRNQEEREFNPGISVRTLETNKNQFQIEHKCLARSKKITAGNFSLSHLNMLYFCFFQTANIKP